MIKKSLWYNVRDAMQDQEARMHLDFIAIIDETLEAISTTELFL